MSSAEAHDRAILKAFDVGIAAARELVSTRHPVHPRMHRASPSKAHVGETETYVSALRLEPHPFSHHRQHPRHPPNATTRTRHATFPRRTSPFVLCSRTLPNGDARLRIPPSRRARASDLPCNSTHAGDHRSVRDCDLRNTLRSWTGRPRTAHRRRSRPLAAFVRAFPCLPIEAPHDHAAPILRFVLALGRLLLGCLELSGAHARRPRAGTGRRAAEHQFGPCPRARQVTAGRHERLR
jgi:hypothetical protein